MGLGQYLRNSAMKWIKFIDGGWHLTRYLEYLERIKERLPPGAQGFMFAEGRYDISNPKCPHDSWLECMRIVESGVGDRNELRTLEINARFLGAFHDGWIDLSYKGVTSYSLGLKRMQREKAMIGHGDWMIDELVLNEDGSICHEILFDGALWEICATDVIYSWTDIAR
jgi:hypothetical protein